MNRIARLVALISVSTIAAAASVQAGTIYDFSYTMSNGGHVITGSFEAGANNGVYVDTSAISAIGVRFDGNALNGPMVGNYYDIGSSAADPIISFAHDNNAFIFSNCSERNCAAGVPPNYNYLVVRHSNGNQNVDVYFGGIEYSDGQPNTSWSLSARPVPEPGIWAMSVAGLAALGGLARRRRRTG